MNKKIGIILGVIVLVLMAIGFKYFFQLLVNSEDILTHKSLQDAIVGPAIQYTKILLYAILVLIGAFTLKNLATNPKQLVGAAIGIVGVLIIYFIAKGQSSDIVLESYKEYEVTKDVSGNVGTGLFAFYWMAGIAFAGAIVGEIVNSIK